MIASCIVRYHLTRTGRSYRMILTSSATGNLAGRWGLTSLSATPCILHSRSYHFNQPNSWITNHLPGGWVKSQTELDWSYQQHNFKSKQGFWPLRRNLYSCSATVYKTLVRPKLEYCASIWDPYHKTMIIGIGYKKLFSEGQERLLQIVFPAKNHGPMVEWNLLPSNIREATTIASFKSRLMTCS